MKLRSFFLLACMAGCIGLNAQPADTHYSSLNGKSGINLLNAISACAAKGYHSLGYDGLWSAYQQSDSRNGKIWDMYSDCDFSYSNRCGNYHNECDCYNREHSVPKSWWGGSESNQGCDLFILVPTDGKVNGMRSNYPFGEVASADYTSANGSKRGTSAFSEYSGIVFEPIDEYKGDFARGILGAMVKWKGAWTQGEGSSTFNGQYTSAGNYGLTNYGVTLLLKWHRQDPVSEKELARNNGIEQTQGNRNPFIDYPDLVEYLWGNKKDMTLDLASLNSAYGEQWNDKEHGQTDPDDDENKGDDPNDEIPTDGTYMRLTASGADISGIYLFVNEEYSVCLNGALSASDLGKSGNVKGVTIANGRIEATTETDAAALTVQSVAGGYTIQTTEGYYIGTSSSDKNVLDASATERYVNTIAITGSSAIVTASNGRVLQYNDAASCFRYYKQGSQKPFALYRKEVGTSTHTEDLGDNIHIFTEQGKVLFIAEQSASFRLFDMLGRLVSMQEAVTEWTTTLPQGVYFVQTEEKTLRFLVH